MRGSKSYSIRPYFVTFRHWLARKLWKWALKLGLSDEAEIQAMVQKALETELERRLGVDYPKAIEALEHGRVYFQGEARNIRTVRSRRT